MVCRSTSFIVYPLLFSLRVRPDINYFIFFSLSLAFNICPLQAFRVTLNDTILYQKGMCQGHNAWTEGPDIPAGLVYDICALDQKSN